MRKAILMGVLTILALLLASGVALAATINGTNRGDVLNGGPGHDRIIAGAGTGHKVYARDGEQDLICVSPDSNGQIKTADPQDEFIFNNSC